MVTTLIAAVLLGAGVALLTTPAGLSGAVFLLPLQVGVLGVPNPAATPTNLMFNLVATPAGLVRWWRAGAVEWPLVRRLAAVSLPGVVVGGLLRVSLLAGRVAVTLMIGVVLSGIGASMLAGSRGHAPRVRVTPLRMRAVALLAGVVSGAYGMGGGSIIAPALVAMGLPARRVAPAALATTFLTSVAGVAVFEAIAVAGRGSGVVRPDWAVGLALGAGGALGATAGARLHGWLPEPRLRLLLGVVALAAGTGHLVAGVLGLR